MNIPDAFTMELLLSNHTIWFLSIYDLCRTALLPALQVEEIALGTFPREFLLADTHVLGQGTFGAVVVFLKDKILAHTKDDAGTTDEERNLDPGPQFAPFLRMRLVGVAGHDFLLVGNAGTELGHSLGLHLCFGTQSRNGLDRAAAPHGGHQVGTAGQALGETSNNERLE
jgi:hypothetical protein